MTIDDKARSRPVVLAAIAVMLAAGALWISSRRQEPPSGVVEAASDHGPASSRETPAGIAAASDSAGDRVPKESVTAGDRDAAPRTAEGQQTVSDPTWEALFVGGVDLRQFLLTSAVAVTAEQLLRHQELNPRDVYLSPDKRRELRELMKPLQKVLHEMLREQSKVSEAEFSERIASGSAAFVDEPGSDLDLSKLPGDATKKYNSFRRQGGRIYMVDTDTLPRTESLNLVTQAKSAEMAGAIAQWFHLQGALSSEELGALLVRLSSGGRMSWNAERNR